MKILFTQFTPPYKQTQTCYIHRAQDPELAWLKYNDWYGLLRKNLAKEHEVTVVSLAKKRRTIIHNGYKCEFVPVENPGDHPSKLFSYTLGAWMRTQKPDVVHIIGTGHLMADFMIERYCKRVVLWERGVQTHRDDRVGRVVLPMDVPLGVNIDMFRPMPEVPKHYDIVSVGHMGLRKRIDVVQDIARKYRLRWLHIGGIIEGWPFTKWQDSLFMRRIRDRFMLRRVKVTDGHICGYFPHEDVPRLLNSAKVMVHPSEQEGACRAAAEAMACGLPVIAKTGVVPFATETCTDEFEGDSYESHSMWWVKNEQSRLKAGQRSYVKITTKHTPLHLWKEVEKINAKIVDNTRVV